MNQLKRLRVITGDMSIIQFRKPRPEDGKKIWSLVDSTGVLDLNSAYSYMMLCKYFPDTCAVAEKDGRVVGFVSAFHSPDDPQTLFVWQVAVAQSERRKGLGIRLLKEILGREACREIRYLETTISPSNMASQSLFQTLARDLKAPCRVLTGFSANLFPGGNHEDEPLYRIGAFKIN